MKSKYCLVVLLILCTLVFVPSCKKTEEGGSIFSSITSIFQSKDKDSSAATSSASTPANKDSQPPESGEQLSFPKGNMPESAALPEGMTPDVNPKETVQEEAPSKGAVMLMESQTEEKETVIEEEPILFSNVYRGGSCFILGEFAQKNATVTFRNMSQDDILSLIDGLLETYPNIINIFTYEMVDNQVFLSYESMTEGEIRGYWNTLKTYVEAFNRMKEAQSVTTVSYETIFGDVSAAIYPMEARITVPSTVTETVIINFLSSLIQQNPEVLNFCSYRYEDGVVILSFQDALPTERALYYWEEIKAGLAPYAVPVEEAPAQDAAEETAQTTPAVTRIAEESDVEKTPVTPVTKTGSFIKEKSFAVSASATVEKPGVSVALMGRFEARLSDTLSVGIKTGFQTKQASFPVEVYGKMEILTDLYAFAGLGVRFNVGSKPAPIAEIGVGYEWEITDELRVFAEGSILYDGNVGLRATVGGRYSF